MVKSVTLTGLRSFNKSVYLLFLNSHTAHKLGHVPLLKSNMLHSLIAVGWPLFVFLEVVVCLHMVRLLKNHPKVVKISRNNYYEFYFIIRTYYSSVIFSLDGSLKYLYISYS